jgi:hypothetical protein
MKISNFDRQTVKALRTAMDNALASVEAEYGIKISTGNATFSGDEVTFKVKANAIGVGGQVKTKEAANWDVYAGINGLGALSVGDTIDLQGKSFTIAGWNSRARKSPISITDANGRGYKCSVEMVKMYNRNLVA